MTRETRIIKILAGLVAGVGTAIVIIIIGDALAHRIVPPPAGADVYAANDPSGPATATLVGLILGWFLAGLAGGWIAVRIARAGWTAWAVAGVIILAAVYLFTQVAHPLWTMAGGIAAPLAGAWLVQRRARESARPG